MQSKAGTVKEYMNEVPDDRKEYFSKTPGYDIGKFAGRLPGGNELRHDRLCRSA